MRDLAGNNRRNANTKTFKGLGTKPIKFSEFIGDQDTQDYFKVSLNQRSSFQLTLADLKANANVELLNRKGKRIEQSKQRGTKKETIQTTLESGTYFIRVYQRSGDTTYSLELASPLDPGNTLDTAKRQTSARFSQKEWVDAQDASDFYKFNIDESGIFTAKLSNLTGDADVRLIADQNGNGKINFGINAKDVIAWQWERGTKNESIRKFLEAGDYILQVMSYNKQKANYTVETNFKAAARDNRQFSINITFSDALSQYRDVPNAIQEAARFWESAITHTTLDQPHTLEILVDSAPLNSAVAQGGPDNFKQDQNGVYMPIAGTITYDTNSINQIGFNRRLAIHEMGHVLKLVAPGSEFYDFGTSTYKAKSYAGWAYGELLGTYKQTSIPMSNAGHWDYTVIENEALNTYAGPPDGLVSQITIAALRDIGWNVNYGAADVYTLP